MMDPEKSLTGENLAFYKNIQYLKELTDKAKAVITRSYAKYEDILRNQEHRMVRALDSPEEDRGSVSTLGECVICGLIHGARGFCIVEEIIKSEKIERENATTQPAPKNGRIESQEPQNKQQAPTRKDPLLRDMSPAELGEEYSKICLRHGVKSGKNFLLARSLSKDPSAVEPLFTSTRGRLTKHQKLFSIMNSCVPERESIGASDKLCSEFSGEVLDQMSTLLKPSTVCGFTAWKDPKIWKKALGGGRDRKSHRFEEAERVDGTKHSLPKHIWFSKPQFCVCGNIECDCNSHTTCSLPKKNCPLANTGYNNYVLTIRDKLKRRRESNFKQLQSSNLSKSLKSDGNVLRKDSQMLLKKANQTFQDDLKTCLSPVVDVSTEHEKKQFDENISKIAKMTSQFTRPDDRTWNLWVSRLKEQEEQEDDAGISGDSDIEISESDTEWTDYELAGPKPDTTQIPFAGETMKLANVMFDKIEAKFERTLTKNYVDKMILPYKQNFYCRAHEFMLLRERNRIESIAADVCERLNVCKLYLKSFQPFKVRKSQKLKRLNANRKILTKAAKRRNFNLGIQLGQSFRRVRHSAIFKEEKGFVGFKSKERELLQKPIPERFTMTGLVKDESDKLWLTKERIHRHYRLLRTLFDGSSQNVHESLMDEGMKTRLESFRKSLPKTSKIEPGTFSEDEIHKPANVRRATKRDEMKLKSAQEYISNEVSRKGGHRLSSTDRTRKRTIFGKSHDASGTKTLSNTKTVSHETNTEPRALRKSSYAAMSKDFSYGKLHSHLEAFRLPTPPLSDSSDEESLDYEIQNRVPQKEEAHMEQSSLRRAAVDDRDVTDLELRSHGRNLRLDESELTDSSSDSYVPNLLSLADRTAKIPVSENSDLRRHAPRGFKKTQGRIQYPYQYESSSDSDPGEVPCRVRSAWDHKLRIKNISQNKTQKDHERRTSPKKTAAKSILPKPGASILKKTSLPEPPSGSIDTYMNTNSGVTAAKRQTWSESSYKSTSYPSESLIRPAHVVTERLLKTPQEPGERLSRITTEGDRPSVLPSRPGVISVQGFGTASIGAHSSKKSDFFSPANLRKSENPVIEIPSKQSEYSKLNQQLGASWGQTSQDLGKQGKKIGAHSKEDPTLLSSSRQNKQSQLSRDSKQEDGNQSITVKELDGPQPIHSPTHPVGGSVSRSDTSSRQAVSRVMSDLFRKRSILSDTVQSERIEKKDPITRKKSGKKSVGDSGLPKVESSAQSLVSALRKIAPTKKRVFNVDIGQGINVVNFLKESAPGADSKKQKDLADLLVTPVEVKRTPIKPTKLVESSDDEVAVASSGQSKQGSRSVLDVRSSSQRTKAHGIVVTDDMPTHRTNFKTLDQIFKEVHGINAHNTPAKLVENEYEYETKKKQQLTRHKILP